MNNNIEESESGSSTSERIRRFVLLEADRWVLATVILVLSFVAIIGASFLNLTPLRVVATDQDTIESLFSAFIGAIITGTAIVITINQLVLAQELGAVGDQYDRMREAVEFRQDVEAAVGLDLSAIDPATFLCQLLDGIERQAESLGEAVVTAHDDDDLRREFREYSEELARDTERVSDHLEGSQFGTFAVVSGAMTFDYSRRLHQGRALQEEYGEAISEEANDELDDLLESLTIFAPAREHIKTLYFQWELISLSQALVYSAIPGLVVMVGFILFVDASTLPGQFLGVDHLVWLTAGGVVVGMTPFVIFSVYILRITTVAKRTLAIGTFVLAGDQRDEQTE